jgi:pimeloyl-ACP methyl ester carboxylesterase
VKTTEASSQDEAFSFARTFFSQDFISTLRPQPAAQVAATGDYGDIPLVVLSAGNPTTAQMTDQEAVARLSSTGKIIVVPDSGHWIQLDEPQFVIDAIRGVLQPARR